MKKTPAAPVAKNGSAAAKKKADSSDDSDSEDESDDEDVSMREFLRLHQLSILGGSLKEIKSKILS